MVAKRTRGDATTLHGESIGNKVAKTPCKVYVV